MESESVILSIAMLLIERHGAEAGDVAAERARILEGCRDRRLARTWDRICWQIDRIAPAPESESLAQLFDLDEPPAMAPAVDALPAGAAREDAELVLGE